MKILNEMKDMVFILLVTGVFSWVANLINIHPDLGASAIGVFLLVVLASIGIFISKLPGFHKLPMVFWVSIVAVMVSIPGFPGGDVVISYTTQPDKILVFQISVCNAQTLYILWRDTIFIYDLLYAFPCI